MPALILFYRLIVRPLRAEPLRTGLTVLAIALGVAIVLAIELAGDAAAGSFRSSVETLTGQGDFEITTPGGLPPSVLTSLAQMPYALELHPRIEDYALVQPSRRRVPLLGLDLLNEATEPSSNTDARSFAPATSVWTGEELPYRAGDRIQLLVNDSLVTLQVAGVLGPRSGEAVVMDLSAADDLLRRRGTLDRIMVTVPQGRSTEEWNTILRKALPSGVQVAPAGSRTSENRRMLAAFRWNLRVLSYIALVVGAFLIYNTISVSVVRRRAEIGVLRALGASRSRVLAAFLGEAAVLGGLGALAGVGIGLGLARSAVQLISGTVESLYVSSRPAEIVLSWPAAALALLAGTSVAVLSALAPAGEAAHVSPTEAISRGRREHVVRTRTKVLLLASGALAIAAVVAAMQSPIGGKPLFGYLSAVLGIAASAFALPPFVSLLSRAPSVLLRRLLGVEALLAARSLAGSLRRTSVLAGALSTAIAMTAAVGIMVGSFRETVVVWMNDRLQADLYLHPVGAGGADRHPTMSAAIADRIEALPEVAAVDRFRAYAISYGGLPATLGAGEARVAGKFGSRPMLSGADPRSVFPRLIGRDSVLVSEPFANKHNVRPGDTIHIPIAGREAAFRVLDVYSDYSSERGFIIMDRGTLLKYLPDPDPSNIAVYLKPGIDVERGRAAVERSLSGAEVAVYSNRKLREEAIAIFDRTFAITYALEAVAVFVAVMGIAGALVALVIDRRRELGLLRFLGCAQGQIKRIVIMEAALLGLLANVSGLVLGTALSLLLIYVINRQSFGWTIQFHWPVAVLIGALSLVYAATVLAAWYPARIAARLNPIEVVHED